MKYLSDRVILNRRWQIKENGAWLMAIPQRLISTDFSMEEFQDNLIRGYGIVPLDLPTDCDGCGKKFLVPHALSCSKGGIILERHNDDAK